MPQIETDKVFNCPNELISPKLETSNCGSSVGNIDPDKLIKPETVRELCGGVSDMSIWRWLQDPELGFPVPVHISKNRYWFEVEVRAWINEQRRKSRSASA
ncbi:helix-turn-helix transcriptional regulator [Donghicola tyrosinivorans]|uniref:Putative DNA-binding transcriptional regulator AlpA n=1 Tax=Donghicola tyrosinivorans TaxID=1652492 RepID=A0A2T0WGI3_9RHOB|nr:hypothetical protein [Donghicola tyrosinivorans]PRY85782.1 putative DNA-binding transcriptional regulator AlpA [Donghicola tyrosinivorans]